MRWMSHESIIENEDLYHQRDDLSQSKIKDHIKSPELFFRRHVAKVDKPESKSCYDMGKEVHESVLLRGSVGGFKVIPAEVLSKDGKKAGGAWKEFEKQNEGTLLFKLEEAERFDQILDAIMSHPVASQMMAESPTAVSEMTLRSRVAVGTDAEECIIKSRVDRLVKPGEVWDLKTTGDLDRMKWTVRDFGYDIQAYVYGAAADAHFGIEGTEVTFVVVETKSPFRVRIWKPTRETLAVAADKTALAVADILDRRRSGEWNSYDWCAINWF